MARKGDFSLVAVLRGEDDLTKPWGKALDKAERKVGRSFSNMEKAALRATRIMRKGAIFTGKAGAFLQKGFRGGARAVGTFAKVAGATAGVAALAIDQYGKFELQIARLGNVIGDGIDPVSEYSGTLRKMAAELGVDPIETAQAAYMAFSGGVKTSKKALMDFLPTALKAAKAGFAEPAVVVDALTTALNVFGSQGETAKSIVDKLFVTEALGKTDFAQIAGGMGSIASFAKTMGLSLSEILGPMAAITKQGVKTDVAFTQVGAVLAGIMKPTKTAQKAFKKFKIPFGRDGIKKMGGIENVIVAIQKAVAKDPNAITKMFGRKEALKGLFTMTEDGFVDVKKIMDALKDSAGVSEKRWDNVAKRTGHRIQQMKAGFKLLVTSAGGGLAEGLGLSEIEDIPAATMRASKAVKSASANFASAFVGALIPGEKLSEIDWDKFATSAGSAMGKFATFLKDMANVAITTFQTISDLITGDDPVKRAAAKQGLTERKDLLEESIDAAKKADPRAGLWGGSFAYAAVGEQKRLEDLRDLRRNIGQEKFDVFAASPLGAGAGASGFGGTLVEQAIARARAGTETLAPAWEHLPSQFAGAMPAGLGLQNVGREIVVKVEMVNAPEGTKTSVEAKTKNPKVKIKAQVGKRKGASQ